MTTPIGPGKPRKKSKAKDTVPGLEHLGVGMSELKKLAGIGSGEPPSPNEIGPTPQSLFQAKTTPPLNGNTPHRAYHPTDAYDNDVRHDPSIKLGPNERAVLREKIKKHMSEYRDQVLIDDMSPTPRGDHILRIMSKFVDKVNEAIVAQKPTDPAEVAEATECLDQAVDALKKSNEQKEQLQTQIEELKQMVQVREISLQEAIRQRDEAEEGMRKLADWLDGITGNDDETKRRFIEEHNNHTYGPDGCKFKLTEEDMEKVMVKGSIAKGRPGLLAGQRVWDKTTGESFVLISDAVPPEIIQAMNPIPGKRESYRMFDMPVTDCWLVQVKDGSNRIIPEAVLSADRPKGKFSFEKTKAALSSQALANLINLAAWASIVGYLVSQQ